MEASINEEMDPLFNLLKNNDQQSSLGSGIEILEQFDLKKYEPKLTIEERDPILHCIYRNETNRIELQYDLSKQSWTIQSDSEDEKNFFQQINWSTNLPFDQEVQLILHKFDQYFQQEHPMIKPSTIIEVDEEQTELIDSNYLIPMVLPTRIRHESSGSSANSIKYTEFVPPSTVSVRRKRVIQSIHLYVQQKKTFLQKFRKEKSTEPIIYELGFEFLRIYDGKFNYPPGHTFVISFKNRTWFLTINNIKCVECQLGQPEPRSVLILQYKNKFTTVQI